MPLRHKTNCLLLPDTWSFRRAPLQYRHSLVWWLPTLMLGVTAIGMPMFMLAPVLLAYSDEGNIVIRSSVLLVAITLLFFVRLGYVRLASILFIAGMLGIIFVDGMSADGILAPGLLAISSLLMMCSLLLGNQATIIVGSLSLLAITGLFLYGHNEAHAVPIFIVAVNHFSTAVLVSAVTVLILHLNRIVQSEQQNRQQAQTVAKLNAELQLEMRARIQTEKLLYQKQKLESTGLLAGGIAHDFNNLFTSVLGQASLAQRHLAPDHKAYRHLEKSMKAVQQAAELTRQLLAYTGKRNVDVEGLPATSETFIYLAMIRIIRCCLT